ncbi:MAG: hypothetical protein LN417_05555 [Candidatus Thermoplasmatota archaeon]|nr:hypothetical protein [Candidatus Thermoplasmatota archaeon]
MSEDMLAVVVRVAKLERQNRLMKIAGMGLLILGGAAMLMGQAAPESNIIETEMLILRDKDGIQRAVLEIDQDDYTVFSLLDKSGMPRVVLLATGRDEDDAALRLFDREGEMRAEVQDQSGVALYIPGQPRPIIQLSPRYMQLRDLDGVPRAVVGWTPIASADTGEITYRPPSSLILFDENRDVIWSAP